MDTTLATLKATFFSQSGELEQRLGKIDDALGHYQQAIELYRSERNNLGLANTFQSMGDLERARGAFAPARALYNDARELYLVEQDRLGLGYTCSELARVSHALGDPKARDRYLEEAMTAAKASNIPSVIEYVMDVERELRPGAKMSRG